MRPFRANIPASLASESPQREACLSCGGHVGAAPAPASASTASTPETGGIGGPCRTWAAPALGESASLLRVPRGGGCRPHLGAQKWSVTLIHGANRSPWLPASQDPQAAANLKTPAGPGTGGVLAGRPPWLVSPGREHLGPRWQGAGSLFKERQAANHGEICKCPSVAQIKHFFPVHCQKFLLTTVQWSDFPF